MLNIIWAKVKKQEYLQLASGMLALRAVFCSRWYVGRLARSNLNFLSDEVEACLSQLSFCSMFVQRANVQCSIVQKTPPWPPLSFKLSWKRTNVFWLQSVSWEDVKYTIATTLSQQVEVCCGEGCYVPCAMWGEGCYVLPDCSLCHRLHKKMWKIELSQLCTKLKSSQSGAAVCCQTAVCVIRFFSTTDTFTSYASSISPEFVTEKLSKVLGSNPG